MSRFYGSLCMSFALAFLPICCRVVRSCSSRDPARARNVARTDAKRQRRLDSCQLEQHQGLLTVYQEGHAQSSPVQLRISYAVQPTGMYAISHALSFVNCCACYNRTKRRRSDSWGTEGCGTPASFLGSLRRCPAGTEETRVAICPVLRVFWRPFPASR